MDWIKQLIGGWGEGRKVSLAAMVDHVELSSAHLVLGLKIDWRNETDDPIPIKEILVSVGLGGRAEEPLWFYPLERFERVSIKKGMEKTPVKPFSLPPHKIHTEQIRFISQEVFDIAPSNYTMHVQLTDTNNGSYTNRIKIRVGSEIKYRLSEAWWGD